MLKLLVGVLGLSLSISVLADDFNQFLDTLRAKANAKGISHSTLDDAFNGLTPDIKVLEFDRNQAEFSLNFWRYLNSRVSDNRLEKGRKALLHNQDLLNQIYQKYGVHPAILVAFWGLETNYGRNTGEMNLIRSLATLSFDKRRREFFTTELLALLQLIDEGKLPIDAQGSWAGAMGNTQFMPSSVANYGVDADVDGLLDLWNSKPDIFASSANFLTKIGWYKGEKWGREVSLPTGFDYSLARLNLKKTVNMWQDLGVRNAFGDNLPSSTLSASLILPMGFNGPAFLVYRNFLAILRWNHSILYALSVGHLADKILNQQTLIAKAIIEPSLSRDDIFSIQNTLNNLGFDAGEPDGISGPKTRAATRDYQRKNNLAIDGYVGYQLFQQLQQSSP